MIELKNITKKFYKNKSFITALSDVSLFVPEGKIFGVIGESGAGKSTLIRCVNLLEKPTSGQVIVEGRNLVDISSAQLAKARSRMGMIFQHFNLLASRTVFDNVALPLELQNVSKSIIQQKVSDLLDLVGLEDKHADYPASLSGGQKQRVAIARALANNPKVLLCDEATSALDPGTTKSILSLLKDINQRMNITILLITHEMDVVKTICDNVAVISEGKMIEQGTVGAIFSNPATALTKKFIDSSLNVDVPEEYRKRLNAEYEEGKNPVVKLEVSGQSLDAPVMSEVSRIFGVDNHIISARIDSAAGVSFGILIVEIRGDSRDAQQAIEFFKQKNIKTEVLGYV
ncbi:MAG: methionine ABC transporter ATP-binding protein MetN [Chitinophagaceae bacterium]|nr:methionine ABC transporter ATP-binding protein MetN [Chitinophagaceae bacterium]